MNSLKIAFFPQKNYTIIVHEDILKFIKKQGAPVSNTGTSLLIQSYGVT